MWKYIYERERCEPAVNRTLLGYIDGDDSKDGNEKRWEVPRNVIGPIAEQDRESQNFVSGVASLRCALLSHVPSASRALH